MPPKVKLPNLARWIQENYPEFQRKSYVFERDTDQQKSSSLLRLAPEILDDIMSYDFKTVIKLAVSCQKGLFLATNPNSRHIFGYCSSNDPETSGAIFLQDSQPNPLVKVVTYVCDVRKGTKSDNHDEWSYYYGKSGPDHEETGSLANPNLQVLHTQLHQDESTDFSLHILESITSKLQHPLKCLTLSAIDKAFGGVNSTLGALADYQKLYSNGDTFKSELILLVEQESAALRDDGDFVDFPQEGYLQDVVTLFEPRTEGSLFSYKISSDSTKGSMSEFDKLTTHIAYTAYKVSRAKGIYTVVGAELFDPTYLGFEAGASKKAVSDSIQSAVKTKLIEIEGGDCEFTILTLEEGRKKFGNAEDWGFDTRVRDLKNEEDAGSF